MSHGPVLMLINVWCTAGIKTIWGFFNRPPSNWFIVTKFPQCGIFFSLGSDSSCPLVHNIFSICRHPSSMKLSRAILSKAGNWALRLLSKIKAAELEPDLDIWELQTVKDRSDWVDNEQHSMLSHVPVFKNLVNNCCCFSIWRSPLSLKNSKTKKAKAPWGASPTLASFPKLTRYRLSAVPAVWCWWQNLSTLAALC